MSLVRVLETIATISDVKVVEDLMVTHKKVGTEFSDNEPIISHDNIFVNICMFLSLYLLSTVFLSHPIFPLCFFSKNINLIPPTIISRCGPIKKCSFCILLQMDTSGIASMYSIFKILGADLGFRESPRRRLLLSSLYGAHMI
jgi:hypothetical protein